MTADPEADDCTPFDAIEAKINQKLWDISDEFQKLNDLVDQFLALGIPAAGHRNLEDEIRKVFGKRSEFSTLDITLAAYAAAKAAKAATESDAS